MPDRRPSSHPLSALTLLLALLSALAAGCGGTAEGELDAGPEYETSPDGGRITTPGAAPEAPRGTGE